MNHGRSKRVRPSSIHAGLVQIHSIAASQIKPRELTAIMISLLSRGSQVQVLYGVFAPLAQSVEYRKIKQFSEKRRRYGREVKAMDC
jgi:hypothetical protein